LGLLRKHKGSLRLTRAGHDSHAAWQTLWNQLADRLVPNTDGFDTDATLLLLLYAATSPDTELPLDTIAAALTHLGWQSHDGTPIVDYDLYRLRALDVLRKRVDRALQPKRPLADRPRSRRAGARSAAKAVIASQRARAWPCAVPCSRSGASPDLSNALLTKFPNGNIKERVDREAL